MKFEERNKLLNTIEINTDLYLYSLNIIGNKMTYNGSASRLLSRVSWTLANNKVTRLQKNTTITHTHTHTYILSLIHI